MLGDATGRGYSVEDMRAKWAAGLLVVTQVIHAMTPADTESEGDVGLVVGLVLLSLSLAAWYGFLQDRDWAGPVLGWTGAVVAVGFVAYHATPWKSPVTNPYVGESVGAAAWISVALSVAAGAWAAYVGLKRTAPYAVVNR